MHMCIYLHTYACAHTHASTHARATCQSTRLGAHISPPVSPHVDAHVHTQPLERRADAVTDVRDPWRSRVRRRLNPEPWTTLNPGRP